MYQKNVNVLKQKRPLLYKKIEAVSEKEKNITISTSKALNGETVLEVIKDGICYRMQSLYDPKHEAIEWSEQFETSNLQSVFIIFGLLNGMHIRELKKAVPNSKVIVYEPSFEIFDYVIHNYDMEDILGDEDCALMIEGINEIEFSNVLYYQVQWINLSGQKYAAYNTYDRVFQEQYQHFVQKITENRNKAIMIRNTAAQLGKQDIRNILRNMKFLYGSNNVIDLKGKIPEEIPVIIVAGGPSLDKNIGDLQAAKGKAIILCVDRALNILLSNNIVPDFSITLDPIKPLSCYESDKSADIPIFYNLSSNADILYQHKNRKIIYGTDEFSEVFYKILQRDYDTLSSGGSVATAALAVCLAMGIKRVILVGQDLSFQNGVTHAGGLSLEADVSKNDCVEIEDINGNKICTKWNLYSYLLWFNDTIKINKDKLHVIDATEGGAKIAGTEIMTLKNAIDKYCRGHFDVEKLLDECRVEDVDRNLDVILTMLHEMSCQLDLIKDRMREGILCCNNLIATLIKKGGMDNKGKQLVARLSKINKEVTSLRAYALINTYIYDVTTKELSDVFEYNGTEYENQRKTYEKSRVVYESAYNVVDELKDIIQEVIESLNKDKCNT